MSAIHIQKDELKIGGKYNEKERLELQVVIKKKSGKFSFTRPISTVGGQG